ncbi:hypothetical protein [Sphingobium sp.]|uniref:hypothetical protein n=1 Tax=Sphingobium sp. TaxID=1912891 RepID=UPI002CB3EEBD|nr:hypothetical protein [Sphingobium sp.]HUD90581.1 hypothetical protein [Sphingobium sp.]
MATVQFCNVRGEPQGAPVLLDRRRRRLSTIAKQHANKRRPFMVSVHRGVGPGDKIVPSDDTVRTRAEWKDTLIGAGDVVLITYLPMGGGAGGQKAGKQIGMAVAMIALAVAMPYAVGALGIAGSTIGSLSLVGKAVAAGLTAGIPAGPSHTLKRSSP